jgi:phospholipid/cholesterol/gamma-HCH transport system permease protein
MKNHEPTRDDRIASASKGKAIPGYVNDGELELTVAASQGNLTTVMRGRLTAATVTANADRILEPIKRTKHHKVIIEGSGVTYCDGAGIGLIGEARRAASRNGGALRLQGFSTDLQTLIDMSALPDPSAPQLRAAATPGIVTQIGISAAHVLADLAAMITFLGELTAALAWSSLHPRRVRWRELWMVAEKVGVNAVPVLSLLGFLMGVILAFQSAVPMDRYGARDVVPAVVAIAILRELGPLITAILLAGRSGSAFAAEIGTMKITEELSALESLGINVVRFLAVPRVLAAMIVTPCLCIVCNVMGVLGGYAVMAGFGYTALRYGHAVKNATNLSDFVGGVAKTIVFALLVSGVGCLRGMRTASGPGAVGDSTTRAVVAGIVLVIIADGIFGVLFYYLRI